MQGQGKYDELSKTVMKMAKARGAMLIIIEGEHGTNCSVNCTLEDALSMPLALRMIADDLEKDVSKAIGCAPAKPEMDMAFNGKIPEA